MPLEPATVVAPRTTGPMSTGVCPGRRTAAAASGHPRASESLTVGATGSCTVVARVVVADEPGSVVVVPVVGAGTVVLVVGVVSVVVATVVATVVVAGVVAVGMVGVSAAAAGTRPATAIAATTERVLRDSI